MGNKGATRALDQTPILVVRSDHPYHGCVGYIRDRISRAAFGVIVFAPDGSGYRLESLLLFKKDVEMLDSRQGGRGGQDD